MSRIHIHLVDGFAHDHVLVRVDGRTVLDEGDVTYSPLYGFAQKSVSVEVPGGTYRIEVELPDKGLRAAQDAKVGAGPHVIVSIENGRISIRSVRDAGFG
ncbi:MAG: hypothetical protein K2X71_01765 [Methylobacterium sp.]|uniref:hypothetical protein n=1 Tax=Methylobacterium sp. TaxID=409 RepID=UPI002588FECF|nr:hypothetical protein [Methylobacterium sp.]MBY0294753.1 hypothetical protein [Methylobacterium sp.]